MPFALFRRPVCFGGKRVCRLGGTSCPRCRSGGKFAICFATNKKRGRLKTVRCFSDGLFAVAETRVPLGRLILPAMPQRWAVCHVLCDKQKRGRLKNSFQTACAFPSNHGLSAQPDAQRRRAQAVVFAKFSERVLKTCR
ncbi:hypothetical protein [Kingella potus]|uniref:hypothetical protein n=1 Tax=Kingella potus TaxID=265175 RepID=UPI001FD074FA|nr:hypothetical protein [Kingella potus]UOP01398.1 hypothetical protein LVJ84_03990 [Kingella potus]